MKKIIWISTMVMLFSINSEAQKTTALLNEAIYLEEVKGDLAGAIELYNKILNSAEAKRNTKAKALLHLGMSYEKMGNKQAEQYYRNLIKNYPEQKEFLSMAQLRLNVIGDDGKLPVKKVSNKLLSHTKLLTRPDIYGTVSNEGTKVSFVDWTHGNLAIYDVKTGLSREITSTGNWNTPYSFSDMSRWSPDDTKLVYLWYNDNGSELHIYDLTSNTDKVIIPNTKDADPFPLYWTNNQKIFLNYETADGNKWIYYLLDPESGKMELIDKVDRDQESTLQNVHISPDCKYMAYTFLDGNQKQTRIYLTGKRDLEPISILINVEDPPFWSNKMDKIYFTRTKFGNKSLYEAPFEKGIIGKEVDIVVESLPSEINNMRMGTNDTKFHFTSDFSTYSINQVDLNWKKNIFENETVVTEKNTILYGPSWSPDGSSFAYIFNESGIPNDRSLFVKKVGDKESKKIDVGVRFLEISYVPTNIHWSPGGNHILVTYEIENQAGKEIHRMALVNLETNAVDLLDQDIDRGSVTLLNENKILYAVQGKAIYQYNRSTGEKREIYTVKNPRESMYYLKRNHQLDHIIFYSGVNGIRDGMDELVLVDLETNNSSVLWKLEENKVFLAGSSPHWTNKDNIILVPVLDKSTKTYQFYTLDIKTGKSIPFGESMDADFAKRWFHCSLNKEGNKMLYMKRINSATAWTISNI